MRNSIVILFLIFDLNCPNNIKKYQGFEIDLNNLWKYPPQELHSIINNYEKFIEKIKKKGSGKIKILFQIYTAIILIRNS